MGLGLDVPPSSLGGVFVNAVVREHAVSFPNSATLESGINIRVRLLIFEGFSKGYVLIKGGYVY